MATFNHKIEISNGTATDTYHPETNSGQVYDFTNDKWLNATIGNLSTLTTNTKISLVDSLNELASAIASNGGGGGGGGTVGPPGKDGKTWHFTTAEPTNSLGVIGDMHLNTATYDIREKTSATVWTARGNIKGATGTNGTNGKTWFTGTTSPFNSVGITGDFYLNRTTWDISEKTGSTTWTVRGNIKGSDGTGDLSAHTTSVAPHQYGGVVEWRHNPTTNSLDLVWLS